MRTHVEFTQSPIITPPLPCDTKEIGAQIEFLGIVRETEGGKAIPGLFYEAYEAMARDRLAQILVELAVANPCDALWLIHRLGWVPVGEASLFIRVQSRHRQAALQMTASLVDRLKADVPIWKLTSQY